MKLQTIKVSESYESENNPRGNDFKGPAFDDLVASVKEKGVLVPVIARPRKKGTKEYEIVAGNRRFKAAQLVGLKEIPARIEELTDEQAQEIQIIENLQREDVHPLEEGQAYRKLVEESKYEIPSVAAKVGKSETYVRQRIFLTNLEGSVAKVYRSGKMTDGHAVLIARLSANDQQVALKHLDSWGFRESINDLKEYIDREFYKPLEYQPWLKDAATLAAVGPCKECPPNVPSLFGAVKEGACTDKKCWKRKMGKYIDYRKERTPDLILISSEYSYGSDDKDDRKAVLSARNYEKVGPKDKCKDAVLALVARGRGLGSQIRICVAPGCKIHGKRHSIASSRLTPAEKAKREKEAAAEIARVAREKKKDQEQMAATLAKVTWPLTVKTIDVLLEMVVEDFDNNIDEVGERRFPELAAKKGDDVDWSHEIKKAISKMSEKEKGQLIVEVILMNQWDSNRSKFMKKL
jgi:ParB family chromosome partitioning protein